MAIRNALQELCGPYPILRLLSNPISMPWQISVHGGSQAENRDREQGSETSNSWEAGGDIGLDMGQSLVYGSTTRALYRRPVVARL